MSLGPPTDQAFSRAAGPERLARGTRELQRTRCGRRATKRAASAAMPSWAPPHSPWTAS